MCSSDLAPSQEELEAFARDWHAIHAQGRAVAEAAERRREMLLADLARETASGIPLPDDIRSVAQHVARAASLVPHLPDADRFAWIERIAELAGLLVRALGV